MNSQQMEPVWRGQKERLVCRSIRGGQTSLSFQHQWGKMCCRNSLEEWTIPKQVWMSLISGEMFAYGAYYSLNTRQHSPLSFSSNASQILSSKLFMQRIPHARWSITRNNLCSIFLSVVSFLSSTNSCHYCHQLDAITCHRGMLTFIVLGSGLCRRW